MELWPWNVGDPGLRREAAIAPTLAQIIIVIVRILLRKKEEKNAYFGPNLLYYTTTPFFKHAHIFGDRTDLSPISPIAFRGKGCDFFNLFKTLLKVYFPKKTNEPWVIYFCFGQPGTPASQPPPLDPMDYDKHYNSPEISRGLGSGTQPV